ncbi:hypothetical protein [Evtepia sp.]
MVWKIMAPLLLKMVQSSPLLATTSVPPTVVVFSMDLRETLRYLKMLWLQTITPIKLGVVSAMQVLQRFPAA